MFGSLSNAAGGLASGVGGVASGESFYACKLYNDNRLTSFSQAPSTLSEVSLATSDVVLERPSLMLHPDSRTQPRALVAASTI